MGKYRRIKNQQKNRKSKKQDLSFLNSFQPQAKFDFHGLGQLTRHDIEKQTEQFIDECHAANLHKILIVVGKGRVVRPRVNSILKNNDKVSKHQQASRYNGGEGAFEVFLK